ncbi:conjugal transfer protein TrbD [Azohydromonas caseinilytica]|uniref:Conjugal transfer protein TrbD n=1 Tax=Azohydromonas caseinilytica TaxID=2728836 RepID=A0A848FA12_9BURK|nr:conjugal transfer protein TrbD [Azohydromonas caseinilytica]NML17007.1 conjugal transfer protein TrbD [Azohydromonas caseinilytica]
MTLRKIPVRRSGNRPNLFMGGDREMTMFSGVIAFTLVFAVMTVPALIYGIGGWFLALWGLRWMAKKDPLMRKVYMRSRLYRQRIYLARSTPFRKNTRSQGKQYR